MAERADGPRDQRGRDPWGGRRAALVALVAAFLTFSLPPAALLLGIAAVVLGVRAERRAGAARERAAWAVPAIVLGVVAAVPSLLLTVALGVFWDELRAFQECDLGANTIIAERACREELERAVLGRVTG